MVAIISGVHSNERVADGASVSPWSAKDLGRHKLPNNIIERISIKVLMISPPLGADWPAVAYSP